MNQSYKLPLTEEEIDAIRKYVGMTHTTINCIADLDYRKMQVLQNKSWSTNMTKKELKENIQTFINLYSAIYKAGTKGPRSILYRATNKQQIEEIERKKEIASFTSTSLKEECAKSKDFGGYGKEAVILRLREDDDLPSLYIEPYKKDTGLGEEEELILPFTKVKKIQYTSNWNGYTYYDATLEKEALEQVPRKELETLQAQLTEGYESYRKQAAECIRLEDDYQYISMELERNDLSREHKEHLSKQLNEKSSRHAELRKSVKEYQKQFKRMIKGMCKEKELEIDKQREEIKRKEIEERQKQDEEHLRQLETDIVNLEHQVKNGKTIIVDMLEQYIGEMELTSQQYRTISEDLKVGYSQNLHFRVLEIFQNIKRKLETEKENKEEQEQQEENEDYKKRRHKLQVQYGNLFQQREQIVQIQQIMQEIPQYIREYEKQSFQEIKANLNIKVQGMITKARVTHLQAQKQQVLQEKESKLQKIFYGTTLKEERLANIEAKIDLERKKALTRNPGNSVGVMMANLYDCSAQDLNGEFQPEMVETIYAIRRNFDKLPNEQMLAEQAYEKAIGNYPVRLGEKRPSKRKQIDYYRQDTERIRTEIYDNVSQNKQIDRELQINALSKFEESISRIKTIVEKSEEPSYMADKKDLQLGEI